ncbi:hypothetical protein R0J87_19345, partial [Halomonas sp. SIMBA_159]
ARLGQLATLIRDDAEGLGYDVIDLRADSRFQDETNTTHYDGDQIHLTETGYGVAATLSYNAIRSRSTTMSFSNYTNQALLNSLFGKTSNFGALASAPTIY